MDISVTLICCLRHFQNSGGHCARWSLVTSPYILLTADKMIYVSFLAKMWQINLEVISKLVYPPDSIDTFILEDRQFIVINYKTQLKDKRTIKSVFDL